MKNFEKCFPLLIESEGTGYSNTPGDNGGPTKYGVTIADVRRYVNKNATAQDVRALTLDQAKDIYKSKYWDALSCDDLPSGVDYTCFDYGVNSGLGRPRKVLSQFKSLSGIKLIDAINDERESFLRKIGVGHNAQFLNGWLARVSRVRSFSKQLAQKDNVSGPIAGTITGGAVAATSFSSIFTHHPYIIVSVGIALAIGVGLIIHLIKNKGK